MSKTKATGAGVAGAVPKSTGSELRKGWTCPKCGDYNPSDAKECPTCGTPQPRAH